MKPGVHRQSLASKHTTPQLNEGIYMKTQLGKLTNRLGLFVMLLMALIVNNGTVSSMGTVKAVSLETNNKGNDAISNIGSEMGPIAAGWYHTCAVTPTGGVLCWGDNVWGALGNNSNINSPFPVNVVGLSSGVSDLTGGRWHTCALKTNGGMMCWGGGTLGQLGNNSTNNRYTPVNVYGLTSGVSAIAAGFYHTCALMTTTGGVKCWGHNGFGQLGTAINTPSVPVDVTGLTSGVSAIAAGFYHTCALMTATGGVKCWGYNLFGQLGNNSYADSPTPVDVSNLSSGVSAIAAGDFYTCALLTIGGMKCWGDNNSGQFGNNSTPVSPIPVPASSLTSAVSAFATGGMHTCALTTTGGVLCWGSNGSGELGNNSEFNSYIPVNVNELSSDVTAITTGQFHTCALTASGWIKCWGNNNYGQLGNNSFNNSDSPVYVVGHLRTYIPFVRK
jgi:alpha-tubulin suppressor-like RCC1 family protein